MCLPSISRNVFSSSPDTTALGADAGPSSFAAFARSFLISMNNDLNFSILSCAGPVLQALMPSSAFSACSASFMFRFSLGLISSGALWISLSLCSRNFVMWPNCSMYCSMLSMSSMPISRNLSPIPSTPISRNLSPMCSFASLMNLARSSEGISLRSGASEEEAKAPSSDSIKTCLCSCSPILCHVSLLSRRYRRDSSNPPRHVAFSAGAARAVAGDDDVVPEWSRRSTMHICTVMDSFCRNPDSLSSSVVNGMYSNSASWSFVVNFPVSHTVLVGFFAFITAIR